MNGLKSSSTKKDHICLFNDRTSAKKHVNTLRNAAFVMILLSKIQLVDVHIIRIAQFRSSLLSLQKAHISKFWLIPKQMHKSNLLSYAKMKSQILIRWIESTYRSYSLFYHFRYHDKELSRHAAPRYHVSLRCMTSMFAWLYSMTQNQVFSTNNKHDSHHWN